MNSLEQSLKELKHAQQIVNSVPEQYPPETRSAHQTLIFQTKNKMGEYVKNYLDSLEPFLTKLYFLENEKNVKFLELLKKEADVLSYSNDVYGEIANRVMPTLGGDKTFTSESWRRYLEVTGDFAYRYNLSAKVLPKEPSGFPVPDFASLRKLIKKVTEEAFGWELNRMFITEEVFKLASNMSLDATKPIYVPILIEDLAERDIINATTLKGKQNYTVVFKSEDEPSEKMVQQLIKTTKQANKAKE